MIFWDSSALVALLVSEQDSEKRFEQIRHDPALAVWWATTVECESAIQRRVRDQSIDASQAKVARERLADLAACWYEVRPTDPVRTLSRRLLRTHPLRAADALQLSAALTLRDAGMQAIPFACSDNRLSAAAEAEGLEPI